MSAAVAAAGVVEQLLDHAGHGRWDRLDEVLADDFVITEPAGLPWAGEHYGIAGYVRLMQAIGERFALEFEAPVVSVLDDRHVLLQMHVTFTARSGTGSCRTRVLEVLGLRDGKIATSDVLLQDAVRIAELATP